MPRLIALDLGAGPRFVDELRRAWDDGDAVFPLDQRLPEAQRRIMLDRMAPAVVVSEGDRSGRPGALPTEPGDALVVATSGTSGEPKGVVLTHDAIRASAVMTSAALDVDRHRDRWLCCLPVAHIGGLSVITRALHTDTPVTVHDGFDADAYADAARRGATLVSLVVAALHRVDAGRYRKILLGGSTIPADRPVNTVATYGMTETGSGVVYDGRPLDGVGLRVTNGEVHVHSPTLLRGYRDGTTPLDADGWLPTGDAGTLAPDGTLSVRGRMGDVIVTGGEKVWPAMVEQAMATLPWVGEVAVVGRPSSEWGAEVTAVVVASPGTTVPALEAVRDALRGRLPGYALPRRVEERDSLPRTSLGKVRSRDL